MFASRDISNTEQTRITGRITIHVDTTQRHDNDHDLEQGVTEEAMQGRVGKLTGASGESDEIQHVGFFDYSSHCGLGC